MPDAAGAHLEHQVPGRRRRPRSTVSGTPSSLLNDPAARPSAPARASTCASRSLVLVLPDEPVTPTTVQVRAAGRRTRAGEPAERGDRTSSTTTRGHARAGAGRRGAATAPARDGAAGEVVAVDALARDARRTGRPGRPRGSRRRPAPVDDGGRRRAVGAAGRRRRPRRSRPRVSGITRRRLAAARAAAAQHRRGRRTGGPRRRPPARCSCPLPATSTTSPGPASAHGRARSPRAGRRPRRTLGAARRRHRAAPVEHGGADRGRVLGARVVVGDDDDVGAARRGLAHERPLVRVAVAAGAEHDDQPARSAQRRAARPAAALDRVGLVRVVDEREERPARRRTRSIRPGTPAQAADAGGGRRRRRRRPAASAATRAQRVGDVERTGQRHAERRPARRRARAR